MSAMSRQRLDQVDQARAELDTLDAQYNRALDELEVGIRGERPRPRLALYAPRPRLALYDS